MKKTSMAIEKQEKKRKRTSMAIEKQDKRKKTSSLCRKRVASVFKKARELAILCNAQVAVIVISAEGTIYEFASSNVKKIIARFRKCVKTGKPCASDSDTEEPEEVAPTESMEENQTLRKVLGKDLESMSLHEIFVLEEKLNKGLMFIKDRKIQMLTEELDRSRMNGQQVAQKNKILDLQIEELQASSEMECSYGRPANYRDHLPSTSSVYGHLPSTSSVYGHLPSTSFDYGHLPSTSFDYGHLPSTSFDYGHLPSTSSAADEQYCETTLSLAPSWAISGKAINAPSSGASSSNFHSQLGSWLLVNGDQ